MFDLNSVYGAYMQSPNNSPSQRRALKRALSPYNLSFPSPKQTDTQLRHMAAQAVLKRYRKEKTFLGS